MHTRLLARLIREQISRIEKSTCTLNDGTGRDLKDIYDELRAETSRLQDIISVADMREVIDDGSEG
jgi:hypothetical protein